MHENHRKRLRNRFLKEDFDNFEPVNVLEFVLFYSIPRVDTNEIAHRLLEKFGNINNIFNARTEDLLQVEGIGENSAAFFKMLHSLERYLQKSAVKNFKILDGVEAAGSYLMPNFAGINKEIVYIVLLDNKNKIIDCRKLCEGSINAAIINIRNILEVAIPLGTTRIIIAHNHPGGTAIPSGEDIETTKNIKKMLSVFSIDLVDHIIFADSDYVSFKQSGLLNDL